MRRHVNVPEAETASDSNEPSGALRPSPEPSPLNSVAGATSSVSPKYMWSSWFRALFRETTWFGLAMIALIWGGIQYHVNEEQEHALTSATHQSSNLARMFEEQIVRTIEGIDGTLLFLRASYLKDPANFDLHQWIAETDFSHRVTAHLSIIGPTGRLKALSVDRDAPAVDLSDGEDFRIHANSQRDELYIGKPLVGRATSRRTIKLTRGVRGEDGSFKGVVEAAIDADRLLQVYESIDLGRYGTLTVRTLDGEFITARGYEQKTVNLGVVASELKQHIKWGPTGSYVDPGAVDGIRRLVTYHVVQDLPIVVTVGMAWDTLLAESHLHRSDYLALGAGLTTLILIIVGIGVWHRVKLDRSQIEHQKSADLLGQKTRELQLTLDHMSQGLMMIDANANVVVINQQAIRMLGLPEAYLDTRPKLETVISYLWDRGEFGQDGENLAPHIRKFVKDGSVSNGVIHYERSRPNGDVIEVRNVGLPDGGIIRTFTDVTERKRNELRISHMAWHDSLTNVANRALFQVQMEQAIARHYRTGEGFALLCLDLDKFKAVNDTLGHAAGDLLLSEVAQRLKSCTRKMDFVARIGGDEFAIIQSATSHRDDAEQFALRLSHEISEPYHLNGHQVVIGTSVGIALAPRDGQTADQLIINADIALYRAKAEGRNGYRFFDPELDQNVRTRETLGLELRNAQIEKEFEVHYQPWMDMATKKIAGFEALVRWRNPKRGLVPPSDFIPIAEEVGLIIPLSEWVLKQACLETRHWPSDVRLALNLSPAQLITGNLMPTILGILEASGLSPDRLELEITESVLLQENPKIVTTLRKFRELGISIALDDFGTGYSSLSYLRTFPFDRIKIDKTFVQELSVRADCAAIVAAVAGLGRSLAIATTAEGIETQEQFDLVRAAGVSHAQGFLISRPIPASEIPNLFEVSVGTAAA